MFLPVHCYILGEVYEDWHMAACQLKQNLLLDKHEIRNMSDLVDRRKEERSFGM